MGNQSTSISIGLLTMTDRLLPRHNRRCSVMPYRLLFQSITLLAVAAFICSHVPSHAYTSIRSSAPRNSISSSCLSSSASTAGNNDNKDLSASNKHHQVKKLGRRGFLERGAAVALTSGAVVFTTTTESASWAATSIPPLGSPAPDFALINTHGHFVTLDSLTSSNNPKWTILYFYPGAFTSGCTLEARKFQEILPLFTKANAQVVGVSVDPVEKNSAFCNSEGLDFFMLTDEGGTVSKAYGTSLSIPGFGTFSNRRTFIIDPQKIVRWVFVDVESRIPKHPSEVLEKLLELQQQSQ